MIWKDRPFWNALAGILSVFAVVSTMETQKPQLIAYVKISVNWGSTQIMTGLSHKVIQSCLMSLNA
ncbi:DNA helicase domain protein [Lactobacillus delbrueckii subsp. lactis CRL581]|nr:DNA helicase domain protein [Lactobacillus delbrueckii subsp. lactis CRL581]